MEKFIHRSPLILSNIKTAKLFDKKKALRLCVKKLKKISDPESKLCKAVLINNTLQSLKNDKEVELQTDHKKNNCRH